MKPQRCSRCNARYAKASKDQKAMWNVEFRMGQWVGSLCPGCQRPSERAEAMRNEVIDCRSTFVVEGGYALQRVTSTEPLTGKEIATLVMAEQIVDAACDDPRGTNE